MPESETIDVVGMDVVRRLGLVTARIYAAVDFAEMMHAVTEGIVDGLGFGTAAMNLRIDGGDFRVVAVCGPADAVDLLDGSIVSADEMAGLLTRAERWGRLRHVPAADKQSFPIGTQWVPDTSVSDEPGKWHPHDMLFVPLGDDLDDPIAVLSVDLPPGGDVPSTRLQELLEIFALQAGVVLTAAMTREEHTARLEHRAHHDPLTGLPNRRVLDERFDILFSGAHNRAASAVLVIDIDRFKGLNDDHGHHVGDRALQACADVIRTTTRDGDLVARLGGDEYAVVTGPIEIDAATDLCARLDGRRVDVPGTTASVTLSAGMAMIDGESPADDVLAAADRAMYEAKASRRSDGRR